MVSRTRRLKWFVVLVGSFLFMVACQGDLSSFSSAIATPTRPALVIEVTMVYPERERPTATPTPTATQEPVQALADAPSPTPEIATDTPVPRETPSPSPTATPSPSPTPEVEPIRIVVSPPLSDTATLTQTSEITSTTPVTNSETVTETAESTEPLTDTPAITDTAETEESLPVEGSIVLLKPEEGAAFPTGINHLDVEWRWDMPPPPEQLNEAQKASLELRECQALEEYGFEIRLRHASDDTGFLGVMDASLNATELASGALRCDTETSVYSYKIESLEGTPALEEYFFGFFLVDVVLAQIDPYEPIITSHPRQFQLTLDYQGSVDPNGEPLNGNCSVFGTRREAQAFFMLVGGTPNDKKHDLDPDSNGTACD